MSPAEAHPAGEDAPRAAGFAADAHISQGENARRPHMGRRASASSPFGVLKALPGFDTFIADATRTGRAVVAYLPAMKTRELALVARARIAASRNAPLLVVVDPVLAPWTAQTAVDLGVHIDTLITPLRFAASSSLADRAVLVVVAEHPSEANKTGRVITQAVRDNDLVVVRASSRRNPAQVAAAADRPHAACSSAQQDAFIARWAGQGAPS